MQRACCSKKGIEPDGASRFGVGEGSVEEINERRGEPKTLLDLTEKIGSNGLFGGEMRGNAPLAPLDPLDGGMVGRKAFGRAGESHGIVHGKGAEECAAGDETLPLCMVFEQMAADGEALILFRHVNAGGDDELSVADVQVVSAAGGFGERAVRPPRALMSFVWFLVGGEARVAVDAEERFRCGAHMVRRVVEHAVVDLLDESEHGQLDRLFIGGAALFEPFAAVVTLEAAEEAESFRSEAQGGGHRDIVDRNTTAGREQDFSTDDTQDGL